jgi:hypothetical protein
MMGIVKGWMLENELKVGIWSKNYIYMCEMFACGWFEVEIEYDLRCNVLFTVPIIMFNICWYSIPCHISNLYF